MSSGSPKLSSSSGSSFSSDSGSSFSSDSGSSLSSDSGSGTWPPPPPPPPPPPDSSSSSGSGSGSSSSSSCGELPTGGVLLAYSANGTSGNASTSGSYALPAYDKDCFELLIDVYVWTGVVPDSFDLSYSPGSLSLGELAYGTGTPTVPYTQWLQAATGAVVPSDATTMSATITFGDHASQGYPDSTAWITVAYRFRYK